MFYIGEWDKEKIINHYIENNDVKKVLIIYTKRLFTQYDIKAECEYIEMHDTTKWKKHYYLLEYVNKHTLIVLDNLLVSTSRYSNEYNCISNLTNQTPHRLVFNYLPFIDNKNDFMILLDFYNRVKYKGEPFDYELLKDVHYFIKPVDITLKFHNVDISEEDKKKYVEIRNKLFDEIGMNNPKNIPNNLTIVAGDMKYKNIDIGKITARNKRFKNGTTYADDTLNTIIDLPTDKSYLVELITLTKQNNIEILTSELSIDKYHQQDYIKWLERIKEFYDKANIFKNQCS